MIVAQARRRGGGRAGGAGLRRADRRALSRQAAGAERWASWARRRPVSACWRSSIVGLLSVVVSWRWSFAMLAVARGRHHRSELAAAVDRPAAGRQDRLDRRGAGGIGHHTDQPRLQQRQRLGLAGGQGRRAVRACWGCRRRRSSSSSAWCSARRSSPGCAGSERREQAAALRAGGARLARRAVRQRSRC